ncbi:glutathione S-transferase family protein [Haliangium sp.]|uniref:glutathione S-transferase family protein n=1 Tax=Haliangium sp. TaxID=2663208 RepID=UPI003D0C3724
MSDDLILYHHPFSRAATVLWMLEELGRPYELRYVDLQAGEQRKPEFLALNPMGKLPVLTDGDTVVTETAAIGLYLADRYALGRLAPQLDDPARATYLRWSLYAPSVIEPGAMAKASGWEFRPQQAGWGDFETMMDAIERAIGAGPWVLGEQFSMADVIFGGTVSYLLRFKLLDPRPVLTEYAERLTSRPAAQAATAKNEAIMNERGLSR